MSTSRAAIRQKALELIRATPTGIRYSELVRRIHEAFPDEKAKAIQWNV